MQRLSSPIENVKEHYPVVVVGSGYGGAIAASRIARAGQQVCVLERGKEFQPGEYPSTEAHALREMQVDTPDTHIGSHTGLYDLRVNKDMHVFVGCGLGGTSLVNANVSLRAEPRVFEDQRWPQALRDDLPTSLEDGYRHAEDMLKPLPYPADFPPLSKLQALEKSAATLGAQFYRPPINVTFTDEINHVGVEQHKCELCGDCVSGCNYGAKNTVLMNYLPDAKNHGAEIYTQVAVRQVERKDGCWLVHYQVLDVGRESFAAPTMFVSADVVILAAGTLGSTEILLRSQAAGLSVSNHAGKHFTGNGDVLAFGYNNDHIINSIGFGHYKPGDREPVGPCIAGIIDLRDQPEVQDGMVIEEGAVPGAVSAVLPPALSTAAKLVGIDTDSGVGDFVQETTREVKSLVRGAYQGAVQNTQTYLVMAHDSGTGCLYLEDDRLRIHWPGVGAQSIFKRADKYIEQATRPLGGTYIKNPIWSTPFQYDVITVHPLGGCIMAEDAEQGVVNHKGQVFANTQGRTVYDSLYICDGAIVPRSLGVNPLLTISALAERTCALLAKDRGWRIDYDLLGARSVSTRTQSLGVQFTETMRGYVSIASISDYLVAVQKGREENSVCEFTVTIRSDDVEKIVSDEKHAAKMIGTLTVPVLSPHPLTITKGEFNLFVIDPNEAKTRRMQYRMWLRTQEGTRYFFDGFKHIHNDPGFDIWADTTTLYVTIYRGDSAESPMAGRGILTIARDDFLKQLKTLRITNARTAAERVKALAKFGRFFAGALYDIYV